MRLTPEQRDTLSSAYNSRESVGFVIDNVLTAGALSSALREQVIEDSLRASSEAKEGWPNTAIGEDITQEVASINVPVTVISGELDRVDLPATLQKRIAPYFTCINVYHSRRRTSLASGGPYRGRQPPVKIYSRH